MDVMQFKHVPGVVWTSIVSGPPALSTTEMVSRQNGNSNGVGDFSIMYVGLSVFFKNIYTNRQIISAGIFSDDRPALFCPQFSDSSSPFFSIPSQIAKFFSRYLFAYILSQILNNFFLDSNLFLANFV